MATIARLGEPPNALAAGSEMLTMMVESQPGTKDFLALPLTLLRAVVNRSANRPTTAEVTIGLAVPIPPPVIPAPTLRDWQILDLAAVASNPWQILMGGRRMQLRTKRQDPADDWLLFDGYLGKLSLGWSGANQRQPRWLKASATSIIVAADRELSQVMFGQWRRSYKAEKLLRDASSEDSNECVLDYSLPCVFNPGGRGNCHADALDFGDGRPVHVFCDPDDAKAIMWNTARMLRHIQWRGVQPGPPPPAAADLTNPRKIYDVTRYSAGGLMIDEFFGRQWTTVGLDAVMDWKSASRRADVGPNLDSLVSEYINEVVTAGDNPRARVMLRQAGDVAIERMTTLESFGMVGDRMGLTFWDEHDFDVDGNQHTYLRFAVRGDRSAAPGDVDAAGTQPAGQAGESGNEGGSQPTPPAASFSTRGVFLYVVSDRAADPSSAAAMFKETGQFEGELTFVEDHVRRTMLVTGDPVQYEVTCGALLPGWQPDSMWDVAPAGVDAAIAASHSQVFRDRYGPHPKSLAYQNVGRYWVLNEDAEFWEHRNLYKRTSGAWSSDAAWAPFQFRAGNTETGTAGPKIVELEKRGDEYWPPRRRRFMPVIATYSGRQLDVLVEVQFTTGGTWYWSESIGMRVTIDPLRCAISIGNDDLSQVRDPSKPSRTYITQYLRNQLRIRVTANIESSDALMAWALPAENEPAALNWGEMVDRHGKAPRSLRYDPITGGAPVANSQLIVNPFAAANIATLNRDYQAEAQALAAELRAEAAVPRISGSAVIPWLWRNNFGPVPGYQIADEILGVKTGDSATFVDLLAGRPTSAPCPRIIAMQWVYSENGEQSTTLTIEDAALSPQQTAAAMPVKREIPIERRTA